MGAASFTAFSNKSNLTPKQLAVRNALPDYYVENVVISKEDIDGATASWNIIMTEESTVPFLEAKKDPRFNYFSVLSWFFDSFYEKFFQLAPEARPLFTHITLTSQGRLLAGVISSALGLLRNKDHLHKRLSSMTEKHSMKGAKSYQYGLMGKALIWGMEYVLGEAFTEFCRRCWIHVFSFLLSIIVPIAVNYEMTGSITSPRPASASTISETARGIRDAIENSIYNRRRSIEALNENEKS